MIRVLIIEAQPAVRKGLRMCLDAEGDLCVVGEAADCETTRTLASLLQPDVAIVDLEMRDRGGMALAHALHATCKQTALVILSIQDDVFTRAQAEATGAEAFVVKSMPPDALLAAIRQVAR